MNKKYLFLDRDGVINKDIGFLHNLKDLELNEGVLELILNATLKKYTIFIVTNQSGVARGYFSENHLNNFMKNYISLLEFSFLIKVDWSYCPNHPNAIDDRYRFDSYNRKPNPGMIISKCNNLEILKNSVMVGDKESDFLAAARAGVGKFFHISKNEIKNKHFPFQITYKRINSLKEINDFSWI